MIPKELSHEHILNAIDELKKGRFTDDEGRDSRTYDLFYDGRRYPPKVVIKKACKIANLACPKFKGGKRNINKYLSRKGFIILEKGKTIRDYFYETEELTLFEKYKGSEYDKDNYLHRVLHYLFYYSISEKTQKWAELACPEGFVSKLKYHTLKRSGPGHVKFRNYTWARIFRKGDEEKKVFFTVGVSNAEDGDEIVLEYKLDNMHDGTKKLSEVQINRFNELVGPTEAWLQQIPVSKLDQYNYSSLASITKGFFEEYLWLYDKAIKEIWGNHGLFFSAKTNKERICRICWNTNGWVKPSGWQGKAKSDSHEKKYGFGHEEWLFDFDKVIDGYHYGFLEPVRKGWNKYKGQVLDLKLWTVDSDSGQKYWVGRIKNIEVLKAEDTKKAIELYEQNGWYGSMEEDLRAVGADWTSLAKTNLKEIDLLNVRFKVSARETIFPALIPIDDSDKSIPSKRYSLLTGTKGLSEVEIDEESDEDFDFYTGSASPGDSKTSYKKTFVAKEVELPLSHSKLESSFLEFLQKRYPSSEVRRECKAHGQNRVDIVMKTEKGHIFYEIKTYNSLLTSLRVAFGQLFEYCFYPDKVNAEKLYLVSDLPPKPKFRKYIANLNNKINIPFGYIHFDLEKEEIVETVEG